LTPELLRDRWRVEADEVGLGGLSRMSRHVRDGHASPAAAAEGDVFARLADPELGLCTHDARFNEAHVVAAVAAMSQGRWTVEQIETLAGRFLNSDLVVRLAPSEERVGQRWWSTVEHRHVEDRLMGYIDGLLARRLRAVAVTGVEAALAAEPRSLGSDQRAAVEVLCGGGGAVRLLVSPAGFGKTSALHAAASAAATGRRTVIALAATNKAVAELHGVGLEACTIARFAGDGCPLPVGAVVIIDEISQVSTRDAAVIFAAVVGVRGVQVWCVGDDRQAQSVRAGGLAVHLRTLGRQGAVPMAELSVNRRQVDPADQAALTALRAGQVEASQTIRTEHRWEHETATPDATRQQLAEAAVGDMAIYGAGRVAVLAVSHADCEDLADRIRGLLVADGKLSGAVLEGPGWGIEPRHYQAGDRVLLHTTLHRGGRRLNNGTTGTVTAVTPNGLTTDVDGGGVSVVLPARFVAGRRQDGTPKLSHAWARTVDGAQGGTWDQVHLLSSPALNRLTGYVGQSRGRQPTHTWNVRPVHVEHAGIVVEPATAAEHVGRAMGRDPVKTFAAYDDPHVLDRQLRAERAEHEEVLARRPAFEQRDLAAALRNASRAAAEVNYAVGGVDCARRRLDGIGPLAKLSRSGRDERRRRVADLDRAETRLAKAHTDDDAARGRVARLEHVDIACSQFDAAHAWRNGRLAIIDRQLDDRWADAVTTAVRAGDPFAYGLHRLRRAHDTLSRRIADIDRHLPPDRAIELERAEADLAAVRTYVTDARHRLDQAHDALAEASRRRLGLFQDHPAIERARAHIHVAGDRVDAATKRRDDLRQRVSSLRAHGVARAAAVEVVSPERSRLSADRSAIHDALEPFERSLDQSLSRVLTRGLALDPARDARRYSRTPDQGLDLGVDL
jgi:hypothetical protein